MTIQQFIENHSLSAVEFGDLKPAVLLMGDRDDPRRFEDFYEFYRNADRTIWVSINRTQNWFRIVYHDLLMVYSDWEKADGNYELAPLVPDQQPGM
jgi:hypothetical protein